MDVLAMWDFDRPEVSEERFRAALPDLLARTQLARALGLQRRFDEAAAELDAVESAGDPSPLVRVHLALERGRLLNSGGRRPESKPYFLAALESAERAGLDHQAADAAHMLAIVEPGAAGIGWAERAVAIAEASDDPRARTWVGSVTHNLGWTLHGLGRHEEALAAWAKALAFREQQQPVDAELVRIGRWTLARGLRSLGRFDEALAVQRELAAGAGDDGYVEEELGELLLALGRPEQARTHFARAHELLSADQWLVANEADRLKRLADLGST